MGPPVRLYGICSYIHGDERYLNAENIEMNTQILRGSTLGLRPRGFGEGRFHYIKIVYSLSFLTVQWKL